MAPPGPTEAWAQASAAAGGRRAGVRRRSGQASAAPASTRATWDPFTPKSMIGSTSTHARKSGHSPDSAARSNVRLRPAAPGALPPPVDPARPQAVCGGGRPDSPRGRAASYGRRPRPRPRPPPAPAPAARARRPRPPPAPAARARRPPPAVRRPGPRRPPPSVPALAVRACAPRRPGRRHSLSVPPPFAVGAVRCRCRPAARTARHPLSVPLCRLPPAACRRPPSAVRAPRSPPSGASPGRGERQVPARVPCDLPRPDRAARCRVVARPADSTGGAWIDWRGAGARDSTVREQGRGGRPAGAACGRAGRGAPRQRPRPAGRGRRRPSSGCGSRVPTGAAVLRGRPRSFAESPAPLNARARPRT